MSWDKDTIQSTTPINQYPTRLTDNFTAIQEGQYDSATPTMIHDVLNLTDQTAHGDSSTPTSDIARIYAKKDATTTYTELWYKNTEGTPIQLTNADLVLSANPGYTFLPGGILLQFGRTSVVPASDIYTITFPKTFSTIYSFTGSIEDSTAGNVNIININSVSGANSVFKIYPRGTSSALTVPKTVHWFAIGAA